MHAWASDKSLELAAEEWTTLHAATLSGHVEVVATLMQHGADVQATIVRGNTPLHHARTAAVVTRLLEAGADLEAKDQKEKGSTALHYAAIHGNEATQQTLGVNDRAG